MFETLFCNSLIVKTIVMQTGVAANLEVAIQLIMLGQAKSHQLDFEFGKLQLPLAGHIRQLIMKGQVFDNVCKLLSVYLINKIQIDYPISQAKTVKQIQQENYLLACELQRQLTDKQANPFGAGFDPAVRLLHNKFLKEAFAAADVYNKTSLHNLREHNLLNISLHDITDKYERLYKPDEDLVKANTQAKMNIQLV